MRVFVAGASGALGRPVVRRLVERGHEVTGLTRTPAKAREIAEAGATPAVADALDPAALREALRAARPDAVAHLLTALPPGGARRDADLEATNRIRVEGTANLLAAGAPRVVAESFLLVYGFGDHGPRPLGEDGPLKPSPGTRRWRAVDALRSLEAQVLGAGGVALRFGMFRPAPLKGMPRIGGGGALGSWVHVEDAAEAVVRALEKAPSGRVYNIADDGARTWRDVLGPGAWNVPLWLARLLAPLPADFLTTSLALSNARARAELGWAPTRP